MLSVLYTWQTALDKDDSVRALLIDFGKAFDRVNHIVFNKVDSRGVLHCLLRWFWSYLTGRQQRVRAQGAVSQWLTLNGAMPQGSWLGPIFVLFCIANVTFAHSPRFFTQNLEMFSLEFDR